MYKSINLNEHEEYLKLLSILEKKTKAIEFVLVDENDTRLVDEFKNFVTSEKEVNKWWGTETSKKCKMYNISATHKIFSYLKKISTFCLIKTGKYGDYAETTDFGMNDIAFFDEKSEPILFTTTHEGYIEIRDDIKF